jgi:hypothetical protein
MLVEARKCEVLPGLSNAGSSSPRGPCFRVFVWMKLWSHVELLSPYEINALAAAPRKTHTLPNVNSLDSP